MYLKITLSTLFLFLGFLETQAQGTITPVSNFGTNPGQLNMYTYIPAGITGPAPLIIAMHGCTQNALTYSNQTGWNKLANLHKFYVVYPEQVSGNNSSNCFNWFDTTDINKSVGEALSVKQMVDYMKLNYTISASQVYVTGLSAGAGLTVVMLATYPEVFSRGAVMAGLPYKAATSSLYAYTAMTGGVTKTPAQWGSLVRAQNPTMNVFPKVAIFHGTSDITVYPANATELIKQWTNLNHADQTVDSVNNSFQGNSNVQQNIYNDSTGKPVVVYYKITGMAHGIAVDTGSCPRQGGATGTYALKEPNFHSTYWAADFFNILGSSYPIKGLSAVAVSVSNVNYSVPLHSGSTYNWTVPKGATITNGQGTNSINVTFGSVSGDVEVTETLTGGCKQDAGKIYVTVSLASGIPALISEKGRLIYDGAENCLLASDINLSTLKSLEVYNTIGQLIQMSYSIQDDRIRFDFAFPRGIYIIRLQTTASQHLLKISRPY
jgi:poly(hydroxyalkanoate) depolymerase family esterase